MSGSDVTLDPTRLKETVGRFELVQQNVRDPHIGVTFVSQVPDKLPKQQRKEAKHVRISGVKYDVTTGLATGNVFATLNADIRVSVPY